MEALLISDEEGKETKVGTPTVSGSKVEFKVLEQYK
jgi:ribosomal protein L21